MGTLLLKSIQLDGRQADILIQGNRIARIADCIDEPADRVLDGAGKTVIPGLINMHTHSSMTLLRRCYEDQPLKDWLERTFNDMGEDQALQFFTNTLNWSTVASVVILVALMTAVFFISRTRYSGSDS